MDVTISSVFKTFRGKRCIVVDSFKLTESNVIRNGFIRFRCANKKCSVSILTDSDVKSVIECNSATHNHSAYTEQEIASQKMKVSVKRKAVESIKEKPTSIIRRELMEKDKENCSEVENSEISLMRRVIYRERKKAQPASTPKTLQEASEQLYNLQSAILTRNEQFCHVNEDRSMIIFTCKDNLTLLKNCACAFGDGTFRCAPDHFQQMYTIHSYEKNFYVPVAFCFLAHKSAVTYELMWTELQKLSVQMVGQEFNLTFFHADFEIAAHKAILNKFPGCQIIGCRFHVSQSWFRHIQSDKFLLRAYNDKNSETGKWLKYFFGLSLLPPEEVFDGYLDLQTIAPVKNHAIDEFCMYICSNYIILAQFPPEMWAAPPSESPRTTNGAESFHASYNAEFYSSHPCVHDVTRVLQEIQSESYTKLASIRRNVQNPVKKSTADRLKDSIKHWNEYRSGERNTSRRLHYLKEMGYLYQAKKI